MRSIKVVFPFLIVLLSITSAIYRLTLSQTNWDRIDFGNDVVMNWDSRIQPLRQAIPPEVKQVGYLDKAAISGNNIFVDGEEFFLMQYSVAPVILVPINPTKEPWMIGNFEKDTDFEPWLYQTIGEYELQSFGFGLYLIHKIP